MGLLGETDIFSYWKMLSSQFHRYILQEHNILLEIIPANIDKMGTYQMKH